MKIKLATTEDYEQIAEMRWQHAYDDDQEYGEKNTEGIDREEYIRKVIEFLNNDDKYKIFVTKENDKIVSCMFVYLIPKVPNPNGNSKYIAYLTKVYTLQEYRNMGLGTELLNYIKNYLKDLKCELIFAWPSDNSLKWYEKNEFSNDNDIMECVLMDE